MNGWMDGWMDGCIGVGLGFWQLAVFGWFAAREKHNNIQISIVGFSYFLSFSFSFLCFFFPPFLLSYRIVNYKWKYAKQQQQNNMT